MLHDGLLPIRLMQNSKGCYKTSATSIISSIQCRTNSGTVPAGSAFDTAGDWT